MLRWHAPGVCNTPDCSPWAVHVRCEPDRFRTRRVRHARGRSFTPLRQSSVGPRGLGPRGLRPPIQRGRPANARPSNRGPALFRPIAYRAAATAARGAGRRCDGHRGLAEGDLALAMTMARRKTPNRASISPRFTASRQGPSRDALVVSASTERPSMSPASASWPGGRAWRAAREPRKPRSPRRRRRGRSVSVENCAPERVLATLESGSLARASPIAGNRCAAHRRDQSRPRRRRQLRVHLGVPRARKAQRRPAGASPGAARMASRLVYGRARGHGLKAARARQLALHREQADADPELGSGPQRRDEQAVADADLLLERGSAATRRQNARSSRFRRPRARAASGVRPLHGRCRGQDRAGSERDRSPQYARTPS